MAISKAGIKKIAPKAPTKAEKKSATTKPAKKAVTKAEVKKEASSVKADIVQSSLKITVLDTEGKAAGSMTLPGAIFGAKVNPTLMAQAVRVYLANQRQGNASTKTRGEVDGSTRKIYRQKGTGRARHGGIRAPIFVKGGIAHGPKPRDFSLSLPTKMKKAALFSALSTQLHKGNIVVVVGLAKVGPKTKNMAQTLKKISDIKKSLIVMPNPMEGIYKAGRNIEGVTLSSVSELSTYTVLNAGKIIFMKEAIEAVEKTSSK